RSAATTHSAADRDASPSGEPSASGNFVPDMSTAPSASIPPLPSMGLFRSERRPAAQDDRLALDRLDVRLLQNGAVALYHKHAVLALDVAWFVRAGYRVHTLDAAGWKSAADFHADAKSELALPEY